GWFGVQRDRADARNRLRARELHESDERYRALFEGSSSLIMIIDVKTGEIIHANPAAAGFYGYSLAEMVSLRYSDLGVGGIEQWQETLRCVQEERETRLEVEHRLKDGSVRALRCNIGSLVLNDRQRLYCIAYDGTAQRRTDLALRLRSPALGAASNGVVITDRHGSIEWVNSAFTGLTGYGQHEVVGANPRILKSGVQDEAYYREMWETVAAGQVWQGELVNRRKDGSQYVEEQSI